MRVGSNCCYIHGCGSKARAVVEFDLRVDGTFCHEWLPDGDCGRMRPNFAVLPIDQRSGLRVGPKQILGGHFSIRNISILSLNPSTPLLSPLHFLVGFGLLQNLELRVGAAGLPILVINMCFISPDLFLPEGSLLEF